MNSIIGAFFLSLALSLVLTPLASRLGLYIGAVDLPEERKVHTQPMPRSGGIAVFFSFIFSFAILIIYGTGLVEVIVSRQEIGFFMAGGIVIFLTGLADDVWGLGPGIKVAAQIFGCTLPYLAGVGMTSIMYIPLTDYGHLLSYPLTIFWFLLFVNAINLIDGIDGLAGGIGFFAAVMMTVFGLLDSSYTIAFLFAALAGSLLGFLRYNFNPATIFLGDSGSYFIGYCLAGLSIIGSAKSHASSLLLIIILVMGIPIMDALIAPLRRFVRGRRMFYPDNKHIHHRLLARGLTTRNAVLLLYSVTVVLCVASLSLVFMHDKYSALLMLVCAFIGILFFRQVGYMDYLARGRLLRWGSDILDTCGLSTQRRKFLDIQLDMENSKRISDIWQLAGDAMHVIGADYAECHLTNIEDDKNVRVFGKDKNVLIWSRNGFYRKMDFSQENLLKLELPLITRNKKTIGTLWLVMDLNSKDVNSLVMRRFEQLRGSLVRALVRQNQAVERDLDIIKKAASDA